MSLTPGFNGAAPLHTGGTGQNGTYDETNPLPGQFIDANGGRFYVLGSDPKTGNPIWSSFVSDKGNTVVINGRLVDASTGQVLADFSAPNAGAGGVTPTTAFSEAQANARQSSQLAQQQSQFLENFGADKARGDQQQQLAQGQALGYYGGQNTLARDQLNQNQSQFNTKTAIDYYTQLANLAANPRNYVELLNRTRGVTPPANSAQYSNVAQYQRGNPNIPMPSFMSPPQPAAQQAQPTTAKHSIINGMDTWEGGPYSGMAVNKSPANAGDLTPYLENPNMADPTGRVTQRFASGGVTPEPIDGVGRFSGKRYTIGEKGPEGIVPSSYLPKFLAQRHGQMGRYAVGGVLGFDDGTAGTGDPYNPTPAPLPPTPNDPSNPYSGSYNPYDPQTTQSYGPQVPAGYGPVQTPGVDYGAAGAALAAGADATNPNTRTDTALTANTPDAGLYGAPTTTTTPTVAPTTPPVQQQTPTQSGPFENAPPVGSFWDPISKTYVQVQGAQIDPSTIRQPTQLPQGGGTPTTDSTLTSSVGGTVTPRDVASAGTFGNLSGNMPSFLPGEDQGGGTINQLIASGMLPAFMTRLLGQAHGDQSQGTNTPQSFNLPNGLPLTSSLALSQMTPSERSALESIVSSYGVPWEDYVAQITASSPQGQTTQLPTFGPRFYGYAQ